MFFFRLQKYFLYFVKIRRKLLNSLISFSFLFIFSFLIFFIFFHKKKNIIFDIIIKLRKKKQGKNNIKLNFVFISFRDWKGYLSCCLSCFPNPMAILNEVGVFYWFTTDTFSGHGPFRKTLTIIVDNLWLTIGPQRTNCLPLVLMRLLKRFSDFWDNLQC